MEYYIARDGNFGMLLNAVVTIESRMTCLSYPNHIVLFIVTVPGHIRTRDFATETSLCRSIVICKVKHVNSNIASSGMHTCHALKPNALSCVSCQAFPACSRSFR